jgi:VWFA-related protein
MRTVSLPALILFSGLSLSTAVTLAVSPRAPQQPTFRSGVDIVPIDVWVTQPDGRPVADLRPDEFVVTVGGRPRTIAYAEFVAYDSLVNVERSTAVAGRAQPAIERPGTGTATRSTGRTFMLVVDEANIRSGYGRPVAEAVERFIERADANDRIGLVTIPNVTIAIEPTLERGAFKAALQRITGHLHAVGSQMHHLGLVEAMAYERTGQEWVEALGRECNATQRAPGDHADNPCVAMLEADARQMALDARQRLLESTSAVAGLLAGLANAAPPRIVVLVSEELPLSSHLSDLSEFRQLASQIELNAARVQASVYVLQPHVPDNDVERRTMSPTAGADDAIRSAGLETLTSLTGGSRLMVSGRLDSAFERLRVETSGQYILAVAADRADRDGRPHEVKVTVKRKGAKVHARRVFVLPPATAVGRTPAIPD